MDFFKNFKKTFKFKNNFIYFVFIAIIIFLYTSMDFLQSQRIIGRTERGIITQIGYYIILAVSLNLVVGFLGELSLGHAGFMCVGAYIGTYVANLMPIKEGQNPLFVIICSMLVGGLAAAVFGLIVGLPALRLKGDYLAIVTLAFGEIVRNIFNNIDAFGAAMGLTVKHYEVIDEKQLLIISLTAALVVLFLCKSLIRSKHGRAITAIRDNEIAAKAMGINVTYYKLFVFVLAAFFAGIAGVIQANSIGSIRQTNFSYSYSIEILVMVVLGGLGSFSGSIIAAALITYINVILQSTLTNELATIKQPIYALILIVVVMFNNAPALRTFKEKISLRRILDKIFKHRRNPSYDKNDDAAWNRIETKIPMDEVLSVDVVLKDDKNIEPSRQEDGR